MEDHVSMPPTPPKLILITGDFGEPVLSLLFHQN